MTGTFLKYISLLNFVRTSTSGTYAFTADREPIWHYLSADYDGHTIKYSVVMRATSGDTSAMILSDVASTDVTGSELTTTSTVNVVVTSGDLTANLTNNTDYRARWKRSAGTAGTSSFDGAYIVIPQTNPTKTVTVIELGEDNNVPSTSYSAPSDGAIWKYDASMFDGTVAVYLEADLHCNGSGDTTYCALYDITASAQVSSSEVSHTGNTTTTLKTSGAITLVDGHEYRLDIKGSATSDDVASGKIIIKQTGTITKTACYIPILNTISSGTETSYTAQNRLFTFNNTDFSATTCNFYYEATLKVSANTGYSQLYNVTDSAEIGAVSTASTSYARVRSTALSMPVDTGNILGNYRKIDTSGTVSHTRSFLIAEIISTTTSVKDIIGSGFIPFAR